MEIQYGREYRNLYKQHWWWRAREEAIVDLLRRRVKTLSKLEILDVGCGDALFFDRLSSFGNVEGIEPDSRLIDPANPHRSRIYTLQFDRKFRPGKRYDLILMLDVLEHLDNPEEALDSVRGLLGNNGVFLLTSLLRESATAATIRIQPTHPCSTSSKGLLSRSTFSIA